MQPSRRRRRIGAALIVAVIGATAATTLATASDEQPLHHPNVERWRPLVEKYWSQYGYADEVDFALMVMYAESQGVPTALNPTSDASGLFQHLPKFWADRSVRAGWAGADIFDPESNIAVAAWLRATSRDRGWYHWAPVWDRTPVGSWGATTYFAMDRGWYRNMGGGTLGSGAAFDAPARGSMELTKSSGDADARGILQGDRFTWTFELVNTGDLPLKGISLTDESLGTIDCPADTLDAGSTILCFADEVAAVGSVASTTTAVARTDDGAEVTASVVGAYQGIPRAGLEVRAALKLNETVIRFKNTGLVDLWSPAAWLDGVGTVSCPVGMLPPGGIVTCAVPPGSPAEAWAFTGTGLRVTATRR